MNMGATNYPIGTILLNPRLGTVYTITARIACGYVLTEQYVPHHHVVLAYWPDPADAYRVIGHHGTK